MSSIDNEWQYLDSTVKYVNTKNDTSIFINGKSINEANFKEAHQLLFTIYNDKKNVDSLYFFIGHWLQFDIEKVRNLNQKVDVKYLKLPILLQKHPFGLLVLQPGETATYKVIPKVRNFNFQYFKPALINTKSLSNFGYQYYYGVHKLYLLITLLFLGFMVAVLIYATFSYILQKTKEHLFYGIYALFFIFYFASRLYFLSIISYSFLQNAYYTIHFLQIIGYVFYGLFLIAFLNLKKQNFLYKFLISFAIIAITYVISDAFIIYKFNNITVSMKLYSILRNVLLIVSFVTMLSLFRSKDKLSKYIAFGVFMLSIFSLISLRVGNNSTSLTHPVYNNFFDIRITLYQFGIATELVFFTIALQFKILRNNREGIIEMQALRLENKNKELQTFMAIMNAKDNERTRIAQEIHDDIGSGLTNIRLLSEIIKAKSVHQSNVEIDKISHSASGLIENMNEIIWSINSKNDNLPNLIAYLRSYVVNYFEDYNQFKIKTDVTDSIPNLIIDGNFRRAVFLVIKEALHNILKHSNASIVNLQIIIIESNILNIIVQDNGIGLQENKNILFSNGLRNMKDRIQNLGGNVHFYAKNGVIIHLQIPLNTTT